ncbi:SDR family NAD(P)-dependent oxidoreductase [Psychromonas sp. KJ10-10]|uniref:SDR family NAD(P)-dependent oxidoreductase n=1 Tax=Psychromonas sp. KJ10-10 TaxID=3391823 RepID=UPI0039B632E2
MLNQQTLIIGANSDIAKAIAKQTLQSDQTGLILISRDLSHYQNLTTESEHISKIIVADYDAMTINQAVKEITKISSMPITQVFICHGLLHSKNIQPEKKLEAFDADAFQQVMNVNALTPMLWIQNLLPILSGKVATKIVVFNARVGSIHDNRSGGWYSYRASKAALNMLLKTTAIEFARRAKNIKIISFHPGTTDTPLSKPFHKNVPSDKLFTPDFVAQQLLKIVENSTIDGEASYLDWKGESINW